MMTSACVGLGFNLELFLTGQKVRLVLEQESDCGFDRPGLCSDISLDQIPDQSLDVVQNDLVGTGSPSGSDSGYGPG